MTLRSELVAAGITDREIAQQKRSGDLVQIRRGAYRERGEVSQVEAHRLLLRATLDQLHSPAAASHVSAAVIHDLPVDHRRLDRVHLLRPGAVRSLSRGPVILRTRPTLDTTVVDGFEVTSLPSTTLDLARILPRRDAVAVVDRALRYGVDRESLLALLASEPGRRGNPAAAAAIRFGDARSESAGESHSRVQMAAAGLPAPKLQFMVRDAHGTMRCDFAWPELGVVGEFDGRIKYGRLLKPGDSVEEVLLRERQREVRLVRCGWEVIRLCWSDLATLAQVARIVRAGFELATRRAGR